MFFEQFYLGCLSHASYMLASGGEAVVVDPQRDVDLYLKVAADQNLKIRHILETHLHADFVSGHRELAARGDATIYFGAAAGAKFAHTPVRDGDEIRFGDCRIRVLETPGHTPESVCFLVFDSASDPAPQLAGTAARQKHDGSPWCVLTGDTLFIGDVGRPDLAPAYTPQQLAGMLYDSLHQKLMPLPDETLVFPAHGAGSLCGRNMRADRFSTIGTERRTNYALQIASREEFVEQVTSNLPARPEYFARDAAINREGAPALSEQGPLAALSAAEVKLSQQNEALLLDTRPADQFTAGHVPGSVHIGLGGQFASWAGALIGLSTPVILITDSEEHAEEARVRLARVGIENLIGHLKDGISGWKQARNELEPLPTVSAQEVSEQLKQDGLQVLDVRRGAEWNAGHIPGAKLYSLDDFRRELPEFAPDAHVAVHCKSGYRSMIAASMLKRAGVNVVNMSGGFDEWEKAGLPVERGQAAGQRPD